MVQDKGIKATGRRLAGPLAVAMLVPALLAGCGTARRVEVGAGAPPSPGVTAPPLPLPAFQGAVSAIEPQAGELVVAVQIVWAPVLKVDRHDRRVVVTPETRWEPGPGGIEVVHVGDEVQVRAEELGDGRWRAHQVQLLDID